MANSIYLGGGIKSAFCGGNVKEIWQGTNKLWSKKQDGFIYLTDFSNYDNETGIDYPTIGSPTTIRSNEDENGDRLSVSIEQYRSDFVGNTTRAKFNPKANDVFYYPIEPILSLTDEDKITMEYIYSFIPASGYAWAGTYGVTYDYIAEGVGRNRRHCAGCYGNNWASRNSGGISVQYEKNSVIRKGNVYTSWRGDTFGVSPSGVLGAISFGPLTTEHHFALVLDNVAKRVKVYVDGELCAEADAINIRSFAYGIFVQNLGLYLTQVAIRNGDLSTDDGQTFPVPTKPY